MRDPFKIYTGFSKGEQSRPLDWDESALDTQSYVEGVHDDERHAPALTWLWTLLAVSFLIIGIKIFSLQIINGASFRSLSENNRVRAQSLLAPRGLILDRRGEMLAQNTASYNLVAVPFDLPKEGLDEEVGRLAKLLGLDSSAKIDQLKNVGRSSLNPVVVEQDISQDQSILFASHASEFLGFSVQNIPIRQYLEAPLFSHLLGYTGLLSPGDLDEFSKIDKEKYDSVDFIGKTGIEFVYERFLHGTNGQNLVEVDATGKPLDILGENSPTPGNNLVLNIDKGLQEELHKSLQEKSHLSTKAAAIAINPKNGEVLALISLPGFDNNLFAHGIKKDDYQKLLTDKTLPLFNRIMAGTYPPGSTVKPMVAAAALEEGLINENTVINDRGSIVVPNQFNPEISYKFVGWKLSGLGVLNVRSAIALSSDIFFYTVSGGYPNSPVPEGLGADKLAEYYRKFGVGKPTGIDLPGEKSGLVPDPAWKENYFKEDAILSKWYLGDTYHTGIGQGDMLVTPLQVAQWTAIIANNGVGFKPRIINKVQNGNGEVIFESKPEVSIEKFITDKTLKIVQEGMRETVLSGTAKPLSTLSITSAGKTGTSQFDGSDPSRTHAWFTAYAPYEDPQIVITVLVEAGGEGNAVAEPVVRDAFDWWSKNRMGH